MTNVTIQLSEREIEAHRQAKGRGGTQRLGCPRKCETLSCGSSSRPQGLTEGRIRRQRAALTAAVTPFGGSAARRGLRLETSEGTVVDDE